MQQSGKWQKYKYAVAALIAIVVFCGLIFSYIDIVKTPTKTPISYPIYPFYVPMFDWNISPSGIINASQGSTQEINLTFTSIFNNSQTLIPIENLTLFYYDSHIEYIGGSPNALDFPQDKYFNYSFSQTQLMLQPLASNSSILTIMIAKDAPIGMYAFNINLGNVKANSEPQLPYLSVAMAVINPSDSK